jgi:hypothetical protein
VTLCVALAHPLSAKAQAPSLPGVALTPPRPPVITLAQPGEGVAIPQDRPALVFRFAATDASDPLDLGSLRIVVDGRDATTRFQVTPNEAWGKLDPPPASGVPMVAVGLHAVSARICSLRGACGAVAASVSVSAVPPPLEATPNAPKSSPGPHGFIGALVKVARKIIGP